MQITRVKKYLKIGIVPFLVFAYFVRYAIPQGAYGFTYTSLFYYFTVDLVVGCLIVAGVWGMIGLVKSRVQNVSTNHRHKSFLLLAIFGLGLFGLSLASRYAYENKKFDSTLWKDVKSSMNFDGNLITPRYRMLNDLVENVLPGRTKDEVVSLLGDNEESLPPDAVERDLIYFIGPERGFGVDYECLLIHFDKTGYFQSYETFGNCG